MNLGELVKYRLSIKREMLIGRELVIADKPVLMLGLQEVGNEDHYYHCLESGSESDEEEFQTILYLIYEDEPEDEDWEGELEEPITRRQLLMEDIETPQTPQVSEAEVFKVGEKSFSVSEMTNGQMLEFLSYHQGHMLSRVAEAGMIPGRWPAIDEHRLWCCEYRLDGEAFDADWSDANCPVDVILEKPVIQIYVGQRFLISPDQNQKPIKITITDSKGRPAEIIVRGLQTEVIPGWPDEECEEKHLFIEYEAPSGLQMNFYRTDYLDAEPPTDEGGVFGMSSDEQDPNIQYDYLGSVSDGFDEFIEVELFSYHFVEENDEDAGDNHNY